MTLNGVTAYSILEFTTNSDVLCVVWPVVLQCAGGLLGHVRTCDWRDPGHSDINPLSNTNKLTSLITLSKIMASKASLKFTRLHPDSHKQFQTLVQSAKNQQNICIVDKDDDEQVINMMKNKFLTQVRQEDLICDIRRKNKSLLSCTNKRITWSDMSSDDSNTDSDATNSDLEREE